MNNHTQSVIDHLDNTAQFKSGVDGTSNSKYDYNPNSNSNKKLNQNKSMYTQYKHNTIGLNIRRQPQQ